MTRKPDTQRTPLEHKSRKGARGPERSARVTAGSATQPTDGNGGGAHRWDLCLYVAGETPRSLAAQRNLRNICERYMPGQFSIKVIDLMEHPELARVDEILAIPTLVRHLPTPVKKIIGDLSNEERALLALNLSQM